MSFLLKKKLRKEKLSLMKNKKGMEIEILVWIIIAVVILVVMVAAFMILKNKDAGFVEFIKNLFRFRR